MSNCPCGSNKNFDNCCNPFLKGECIPTTPEELMRSRYTAYSLADISYIEKTMRSPANANFNPQEAFEWAQAVNWIKLEVIKSKIEGKHGVVEFIAHYTYKNKPCLLHEVSEFILDENQWFYINGKTVTSPKVQRNEPCSCGSGKKYKKCCG